MRKASKSELDKFEHAASAIRRALPQIVASIVSRFKRELPAVGADLTNVTEASLADHTVTLIAEVATVLNAVCDRGAGSGVAPADALRQQRMLLSDGRTVYSVLGELHGHQRRKLRWSEAALRLEYDILLSELRKGAGKGSQSGEEEWDVSSELTRILRESRSHALKAFRTPAKVTKPGS